MRILVVEDEARIANALKKGLEQEHYAVDIASTGTQGFELANTEDYAVIILDLMLPGMDGLTVCQQLRQEKIKTPILMLTAKGMLIDKVEGLNTGADDYLTKPFAFDELLARIKALTRRPLVLDTMTLSVESLTLDSIAYTVTRDNTPLQLSSKEFALLEFFMRHPGQIFSKQRIIEQLWSYDSDVLPNTIEVYIRNLRQKVDAPFPHQTPLIQTVRGFGYRLGTEKKQVDYVS